MKKNIIYIFLFCVHIIAMAQEVTPVVRSRADEILQKMTLDEKIDYISGFKITYPGLRPMPHLNIPVISMADGPQGIRKYEKVESTLYPCGILAAATWNRDLVQKFGISLGQDARARGIHILLGPGVNIYKSPLCGRNFEYYGEDPYLTGETAVSYIKGVQSQGVVATIKHFAVNNQEWDRHHVSSDVDERTLHEIYLRPFEKAVKEANVGAVMNSYNLLNGIHTSEHTDLNINILRKKWGFDGILMSDWGSVYSGVGAANGGLDLEMPRGRFMNKEVLIPAIENGLVSEERINEKVRHILETIIAYGFLDREQKDSRIPFDNPHSRQTALELAREGVVLLKNEKDILPIAKNDKILIFGPNATRCVTGGGSGFVHSFSEVNLVSGMKRLVGEKNVTYKELLFDVDISTSGEFFLQKGSPENGFNAHYYDNELLRGNAEITKREINLRYDWGNNAPLPDFPKDYFSVKWTTVYKPRNNCLVKFQLSGDNGYRMFIDEREVISDWSEHAYRGTEYSFKAEAGREYAIRIEYYDKTGIAKVDLSYSKVNLDDIHWQKELQKVQKIVLAVGFDSNTERENRDRTFSIPKWQEELISSIASINKNVIVVLNSGGGVDFSAWGEKVQGILMAWYAGQEGGLAVAEVLLGKVSPSGKLPISIEKKWEDNPSFNSYYADNENAVHKRITYKDGIFVGYRGYDYFNIEPQYPFGFGLSYSSFEYTGFQLKKKEGNTNYELSFDIKNTGKYDAAEIAQIYVRLPTITRLAPHKELKGFEKVFLKKGEKKHIAITLDEEAFSNYDIKRHKFEVVQGMVTLMVGKSSRDILWQQSIEL